MEALAKPVRSDFSSLFTRAADTGCQMNRLNAVRASLRSLVRLRFRARPRRGEEQEFRTRDDDAALSLFVVFRSMLDVDVSLCDHLHTIPPIRATDERCLFLSLFLLLLFARSYFARFLRPHAGRMPRMHSIRSFKLNRSRREAVKCGKI